MEMFHFKSNSGAEIRSNVETISGDYFLNVHLSS